MDTTRPRPAPRTAAAVVLALTALLTGLLALAVPAAHAAVIRVTAKVLEVPRYGDATMRISVASSGSDPYARVRIGSAVVVEGAVSAEPTELVVPLPGDGKDVGTTYKLDVAVDADGGYSASTSVSTTRTTIPYTIDPIVPSTVYGGKVAIRLVPDRPTSVAPEGRFTLLENGAFVSSGAVAPAPDGRGYVAYAPVLLAPRDRPWSVRGVYDGGGGYEYEPAGSTDLMVYQVPSQTTAKLSAARVATGSPVKLHVAVTAPTSELPQDQLGSSWVLVEAFPERGASFPAGRAQVPVGATGVDVDLTEVARSHEGVLTLRTSSGGGYVTPSFAAETTLTVDPVPAGTTTALSLDPRPSSSASRPRRPPSSSTSPVAASTGSSS
ncbi:hypothetical protein G5V58_02880 [Nocardioides anomalus]|uniref:Uncharacterized protein n=1 Tax=Nocardioides anomalus TaxID=2712223 RepID=A0A6G6W9F7_9ACTN|nr:hypothetical protein [Nocardioides anomalus]QIG41864.1 hypothetical protein G5V58_02880 [Nocardioides anomalus]